MDGVDPPPPHTIILLEQIITAFYGLETFTAFSGCLSILGPVS